MIQVPSSRDRRIASSKKKDKASREAAITEGRKLQGAIDRNIRNVKKNILEMPKEVM